MTSIENRNKLQNKGSKGLATTTQLYTVNDIFTTSKIPNYQVASSIASRKELIASNLL